MNGWTHEWRWDGSLNWQARRNERFPRPPGLGLGDTKRRPAGGSPPRRPLPLGSPPPRGAQPGGASAQPQPALEPRLAPSRASPGSAALGGGCPGPLPRPGPLEPGLRGWEAESPVQGPGNSSRGRRGPGANRCGAWGTPPRPGVGVPKDPRREPRVSGHNLGAGRQGLQEALPSSRQASAEPPAPSFLHLFPAAPHKSPRCREVPLRDRVRRHLEGV